MGRWADLTRELEAMLRLRTFPLAYKRFEKVDELDSLPEVRRIGHFFTFCQVIAMARRQGWMIGITKEDEMFVHCAQIHGLKEAPQETDGAVGTILWFDSKEDAKRQYAAFPRVPPGEAIVLAPLAREKFEPDVILIYCTPAQVMLLINALQRRDYERFQFYCIGESSCADALPQCYISGKPSLTIPCFGERVFGQVHDDELVMALPPSMLEKAVEGLRALQARGIAYPVPHWGPDTDSAAAFAAAYGDVTRQREASQK